MSLEELLHLQDGGSGFTKKAVRFVGEVEEKCVLPGLSERRSGGTCRVVCMEVIAESPPGTSLVAGVQI